MPTATLQSRLLLRITQFPGITDRELTEQLLGKGVHPSRVNQEARLLQNLRRIERRYRDDGRIGNYPLPSRQLVRSTIKRQALNEGVAIIFRGIEHLKAAFSQREFTIDGRLVGDLGEIIAALEYDVQLDEVSRPDYDGTTSDGRQVQIKATFKDHLTFKKTPDYYLGFKLYADGRHEEIFNGPGKLIFEHYKTRKYIGEKLLSFPIRELQELAKQVPADQKVRKVGLR